jgi:hypothetical protein
MASNDKVRWLLPLIVLFLVVTGITWPFLDNEQTGPQAPKTDVVILNWKWNKSVAGHIFAVFGEIENTSAANFSEVILEIKTADADDNILNRHPISAGPLEAGKRKYFRHDLPRTGDEAAGFLEVVRTIPVSD